MLALVLASLVKTRLKGKVRSRKSFSKVLKLFHRNSKIIAVLSGSLLKCDREHLEVASFVRERHLGYDVL